MSYTPCMISPDQNKKWEDTRAALLFHCPAFSHILYTMMDTSGGKDIALFTKDVPIAATDGNTLILNPETFFKYNLQERTFIIAHEIAHCMFNHVVTMYNFKKKGNITYQDGTKLDWNQELANVAMDLVINDMLIQSNVGKFNSDWLHDTSKGTQNDSWLDVYRTLYKSNPPSKGGGGGGGYTGKGQGFDQHLDPGKSKGQDPNQAAQDRNTGEWQAAIAGALNAAKARGKLPAGLERLLNEVLEPQVDWREHIQALFARKVGSGSFDWRRADRRLIVRDIYAPGRSGYGAGTVVVAVDTSNSIGPKELNMFFAEMHGILEDVRPKQVFVIWCDAAIGRVDELDDVSDLVTIKRKGAPGGGGTAFEPVFDWVYNNRVEPDALVYLTDGLGSFPKKAPSYPVIWGNIPYGASYPFGDVVDIPKQA